MLKVRGFAPLFVFVGALLISLSSALAQETTGGITGTVKDPSGAVVPGVKVVVTGNTLVGSKETETDNAGYYRFVNLPPGNMTVTATAQGFATFKRELVLEVGHLPTVDITLAVGRAETVVEVSGSTPVIDPTTNVTTTNVTEDLLNSIPTTNVGADYSITPRLILTGRFGYYFENYHDFGYPTTGTLTQWNTNGVGATDVFGNPLPASLQQPNGFVNVANSINFTARNANKAIQADVSVGWTKSGWIGTHNFKFGYQLNRLSNDVFQHWNVPSVQFFVGKGAVYSPVGPVGAANCAPLIATYGQCSGQYGYIYAYDI